MVGGHGAVMSGVGSMYPMHTNLTESPIEASDAAHGSTKVTPPGGTTVSAVRNEGTYVKSGVEGAG